jgi:hypothetical protein
MNEAVNKLRKAAAELFLMAGNTIEYRLIIATANKIEARHANRMIGATK